MPRAIRYLIGFCVAAYGTHRLIPLLEQSDYLRIPVGWSSLEVTILGTLLLAVVFQAVYCVKENDQTRHKFDLAVSVLVGFLFAGAIGCLAVYYLDGPRWLTKMVASVSTILGVMLYFGTLWFDHKSRDDHKRGRRLISFSDAKKIAQHYLVANEKTVFWGFLQLPAWVATSHFSVTGATGSGKTIILRLLMQSVLPGITRGNDSRALIYDAKQDMLSILTGICPKQRIVLLNPFDERGAAWDMAADISSPATAQQVAAILIPEEKHTSQPFFADAARHLLAGVMISFIRNSPENWIFRDVIFAMKSGDRLKEVLSRDESTRDLLEYFKNELTAQNIMSTVATKLQRYEFIAAAWSHATEKISLKQWVEEESILVLGNDEATRTALDAINQVIFKRVTELVLDQSESTTRRTWFFLDEVREAGRLEGLGRLLTKGRSKGACVVLGYQDIEGLREVYGHQTAAEITGQCSNKAILRTDSPETAKWGASLFGDQEILERSTSSTSTSGGRGQSSSSSSTQEHIAKREVLLPSQIMDIEPTTQENGLCGYFITPSVGAYRCRMDGEWIGHTLTPPDGNTENLIRRADTAQYLKAWELVDLQRLALPSLEIERQTSTKEPALTPTPELGILEGIRRE